MQLLLDLSLLFSQFFLFLADPLHVCIQIAFFLFHGGILQMDLLHVLLILLSLLTDLVQFFLTESDLGSLFSLLLAGGIQLSLDGRDICLQLPRLFCNLPTFPLQTLGAGSHLLFFLRLLRELDLQRILADGCLLEIFLDTVLLLPQRVPSLPIFPEIFLQGFQFFFAGFYQGCQLLDLTPPA